MSSEPRSAAIQELRQKLDKVDEEIVRLLARRLETVASIAKEKSGLPHNIRDPERERRILTRVEDLARSLGVSAPLARKIFSEIIGHSVSRQAASFADAEGAEIAVAYQGSPLTYNSFAAEQFVADRGLRGRFVGLPTLKQMVDQLTSGQVDLAFLPIENTVAGSINQVYELLREQDLHIVGEESYKIELRLAAVAEVPVSALRRILSHPLALDQCSAFVSALPQARAVPVSDTREAMRMVAEAKDPTQAAVGTAEAAAAHDLVIINHDVGNEEIILMRYVALARTPAPVDLRVPCKTSMILSTRHEKGALLRCLQILAEYGLSMTKLESRPRPNRPWEYMFFIDFEGNVAEPKAELALEALRTEALYLKILGCYPAKATPVEAQATGLREIADAAVAPEVIAVAPPAAAACQPPKPTPRASKHYKLADRAAHPEDTIVRVGDLLIGGSGFVVIAGPCSVESEDMIQRTARFVREQGAHVLRGGVFKPRTGPYAFQGLGMEGLDMLADAGKAAGMPIITEVMTIEQVRPVAEKADILQIGARNMQNFSLLSAVGKVDRPVLLKRGLSSTIEEWLAAAEYILAQGNGQVILCERGIRTFESATRNTLDLSAVVVLRERTHLPVLVDPSHGTGKRPYVAPMAWAARACGAQGVAIEVHPDPDKALSDGDQSLTYPEFTALMKGLARVRV